MAPPELPGDAPVANVLHPLRVLDAAVLRNEAQPAVLVSAERGFGERAHLDEPLVRQPGLHHRVAAVAVPDGVAVRLDLGEQAELLELRDDAAASLEAIE